MPNKIETQIEGILGAEHSPKPTVLHYFVWSVFGLIGLLFIILFGYLAFIVLRTVLLFAVGSLLGTI